MERTPSSGYLHSKLQNAKAEESSKQQTTRTKARRNDHIVDVQDTNTYHDTPSLRHRTFSPPSAPSAWRGMGRLPDVTPSRKSSVGSVSTPASLGFRETDAQVDKLLKENFDLKMEVYHLREWRQKFLQKEEGVNRLAGEVKRLRTANEELSTELARRDRAVDEAVVMICDLEERLKVLEEEMEDLRRDDVHGRDDWGKLRSGPAGVGHPDDSPIHLVQSSLAPRPLLPKKPKRSTTTLRGMFLHGDKTARPIPSYATVASGFTNHTGSKEDAEELPATPVFSDISSHLGIGPALQPNRDDIFVEGPMARVDRWVAERSAYIPGVDQKVITTPRDAGTTPPESSSELTRSFQEHQRLPKAPRNDEAAPGVATDLEADGVRVQTESPSDVFALSSRSTAVQSFSPSSWARGRNTAPRTEHREESFRSESFAPSTHQEPARGQNPGSLRDAKDDLPLEPTPSKSSKRPRPRLNEILDDGGSSVSVEDLSKVSNTYHKYGYYHGMPLQPQISPPGLKHPSERTVASDNPPFRRRNTHHERPTPIPRATAPTHAHAEWGVPMQKVTGGPYPIATLSFANAEQSHQVRPGNMDQLIHPSEREANESTKIVKLGMEFEVDPASDPSLRRHANLRNRFRTGVGRSSSMSDRVSAADQASVPRSRRNSITRLFSFGSRSSYQDAISPSMGRDNPFDNDQRDTNFTSQPPGAATQMQDNRGSESTPARTSLSRHNSSANRTSHSSGHATSQSTHSRTSTESQKILTPSGSSSVSGGITVTTVRLPFATVDTRKRKPFQRKLSLGGPAIETSGDGSFIGFPRRGRDGVVGSPGAFRHEMS